MMLNIRLSHVVLSLVSLVSTGLFAQDGASSLDLPELKTMRSMNGIDPAPFDRFWEKWPLITVRFRTDNGEQRFIYANQIAYEAMRQGVEVFPDGSVFAKIAYETADDAQFPNSEEPVDFTRMQIMVKNSRAFAETNGWSYWLYVDGVKDDPRNDKNEALACHACHTLVKSRDYIFATPTFMADIAHKYATKGSEFEKQFRLRSLNQLTDYEKKLVSLLSTKPKAIRSLRMRLFSGSLHESIGPLSQYAASGHTYALVDPVEKKFLIAEPLPATDDCSKRAKIFMDRKVIKKSEGRRIAVTEIREGNVCNGVNKWVRKYPAPKELQ